jgi:hypothetical protein
MIGILEHNQSSPSLKDRCNKWKLVKSIYRNDYCIYILKDHTVKYMFSLEPTNYRGILSLIIIAIFDYLAFPIVLIQEQSSI